MSGWAQMGGIGPRQFRCGYCGLNVANDRGYHHNDPKRRLWVCPNCDRPTYFEGSDKQTPGPVPGSDVDHLPEDLRALYVEARNACGVASFTAAVLALRKLLMNIAVAQGAAEGLKFIEYVNHLSDKGYIQRQRVGRSHTQEGKRSNA
jgi:hypothetical protein